MAPGDVDNLRARHKAQVRLSSLRGGLFAPLGSTAQQISACRVDCEKTGQASYTAGMFVSRGARESTSRQTGIGGNIYSGTPTEVGVPTRRRTVLNDPVGPPANRITVSFGQQ